MGHVRPNVHQMGNALAAASFGVSLEEFAYLEKQHYEHRFRELRLGSWQETDEQCTDGGYRHEEMLIEGIAVNQSFDGFLQGVVTNEEVGH